MCNKSISYYDRVAETMQERDGWIDSIYLDFKKAFDKSSPQETNMEA